MHELRLRRFVRVTRFYRTVHIDKTIVRKFARYGRRSPGDGFRLPGEPVVRDEFLVLVVAGLRLCVA